nr:immunoglobulin light chain junction region [Macaca mulatta]
CLQGYSLPYSF